MKGLWVFSSSGIYGLIILVDYDNLHIIRVYISYIEAVIIVHVTVKVILALKLRGAVITFEQNRTGGVYSEYVPLHVIIVEGPVATSPADILLLLVVFRNVMLLQVQLVSALEITICARMRIIVCFVVIIEVLGIVVHILCHKETLFTGITLSSLVINLNMFLHCAVALTFEGTPGTNTL